MLQKIKNIIEGWLNRFRKVHPIKDSLFRDRLKICESNECGMLKLGICTACGCPVKSKTRSVDEECPENMWNPVMYEYEDIQFIDPHDLPHDVFIAFMRWMTLNDKMYALVGVTPCPQAVDWNTWLEFKEYLKEL